MKDWLIEHKLHVIVVICILIGGIYYFYYQQDSESAVMTKSSEVTTTLLGEAKQDKKSEAEQNVEPEVIIIDVKGQVKQPGVYQAQPGDRVKDVIDRAGGLTDQADQTKVNFAERVVDEMVIYIPAKGEEVGAVEDLTSSMGSSASTSGSGSTQGKVNINKADETDLQTLPGIGPSKAAAIIEYRDTNGSFKSVEDLKNISGIGDKTFEKLQDLISVN